MRENEEIILSICIPTYNGGEKPYKLVQSILEYEKNDIEIVVSDNASTDMTVSLLRTIEDPRLKIVTHKDNKGPFINWYNVLMAGNGKYVMLLQDNDRLVVKNLSRYLRFLMDCEYDIIKNISGTRLGISKELMVKQVPYYSTFFSHASNVAYRREALHSIKPLKCSFDAKFTSYPYIVWDIQVLRKYSLNEKKAYLNGNLAIKYSPSSYGEKPSRTVNYVKDVFPSYSYQNIAKKFINYTKLLHHFYPKDCEFSDVLISSFRANLYRSVFCYYDVMENPESRWMKKRYGLDVMKKMQDEEYAFLIDSFYKMTISKLQMKSLFWKIRTIMYLKLITSYYKNCFYCQYLYSKESFVQNSLRKIMNAIILHLMDGVFE